MSNKNKEQAAKTRQAILDAAIPVFQENGFTKARLQDIAEKAGVTRGACYWHFKNKAEIFAELLETIFAPVYAHMESIAVSDMAPREKLRTMFFDIMLAMIHNKRFRAVAQIALSKVEYTGEVADLLASFEELDAQNLEVMTKVYADGIAEGDFKPADPRVYAMGFTAYLIGLVQSMADYPDMIDYEESLEQLVEMILPPVPV